MASNTIYVITGANRGIGLGLVEAYLARPQVTVVGIVRSEAAANALESAAQKVKKGENSFLQVVQLDFSKVAAPESGRESFMTATNGLNYINTLICCAGHATPMSPAITVTSHHLRECFEVNAITPLTTFQALWPLLEKGPAVTGAPPKFIVVSSSVGSIGDMEPLPGGAYGPSKAAVNHIVKSLHMQMEGLVSIALHPGWVQTRMGRLVAEDWNYTEGPPVTVEDSVKGILKVIDGANRDNVSGKFVTQTGAELAW